MNISFHYPITEPGEVGGKTSSVAATKFYLVEKSEQYSTSHRHLTASWVDDPISLQLL